MSASERTGWRDAGLSLRHRAWGMDCPMVDVDFLCVEYDRGLVVALVEYKQEASPPQRASHPSYRALIDLGQRAGIPVFAVRYAGDFSWFRVVPLNPLAKDRLPERRQMTEPEWVSFLYRLRGREMPAGKPSRRASLTGPSP